MLAIVKISNPLYLFVWIK